MRVSMFLIFLAPPVAVIVGAVAAGLTALIKH